MLRRYIIALALGPVVVLASAARADDVALLVKGQALVAERCARCHGTGNADPSPHPAAPPFRVVVERYPSEHLAEALAEGLRSGHPDMPVVTLEPAEIDAFLTYLDSLAVPAEERSTANPNAR